MNGTRSPEGKLATLLSKIDFLPIGDGSDQPTPVTYRELDHAWHFFNRVLFDGRLKPELITLSRSNTSPGWYTHERFVNNELDRTGEITLNPIWFAAKSLRATLAELVHQMVHQLQHQVGKPGRAHYHNKEFALLCEDLGLACTHDGTPVGRRTGEGVTFILLANEKFELAARDLETGAFRITWLDRFPVMDAPEADMRRMSRVAWMAAQAKARKGSNDGAPLSNQNAGASDSVRQLGDGADNDSHSSDREQPASKSAIHADESSWDADESDTHHAPLMDRAPGIRQNIQKRKG